ncbi:MULTISPECIES: hypothetical protein [unclassified Nocardiopsis]|uniref:YqeB family protein n=1 Tax=unclassified Nocardiopsis TaxID=2649073 RepID=UPI001915F36B|nr:MULTISPECIES: hypothetical protein [unclassified Nocardiopsis]
MNTHRPPSVVREGRGTHVLLWALFPPLGAGLGWALSRVPGWLTLLPDWVHHLPLVPGEEPVALLARLEGPVLTGVLVVLGLLAGAFVALSSYDDMVTVAADGGGVRLTRAGRTEEFARDGVAAVFVDGRDLVLLGADTGELARERTDHSPRKLRAAFEEHGYAWHEGDPHRGEYRRWVDGAPGLEQEAHRLLWARREALRAREADDAAEQRRALAELGVVVRDEGGLQYWRPVRDIPHRQG